MDWANGYPDYPLNIQTAFAPQRRQERKENQSIKRVIMDDLLML
jgi:hypothetical protein